MKRHEYGADHPDNASLEFWAKERRYRVRYQDDGELVIRAQGNGGTPEAFWSRVGKQVWDFYGPNAAAERATEALRTRFPSLPFEDRGTEEEVYIRCPEATAEVLMREGPTAMRARRKASRVLTPEQAAAGAARLLAARSRTPQAPEGVRALSQPGSSDSGARVSAGTAPALQS